MSALLPDDLDTPAVVVDIDRMELILSRMAAVAAAAGVALRPHAKTHKCLQIARRQLAHGAVGLTVATLAEAEAFAADGCPDIFIAYPFWAAAGDRSERVRALASRTSLRVGVDSEAAAAALASAVPGTRILIELDSGHHRSGVPPQAVAPLAAACMRLGLDVVGAFTHPGHSYGTAATLRGAVTSVEITAALRAGAASAAADERAALAAAGAALAGVLDKAPELSGGSSPTVADGLAAPLTEARPGTYVFGDRQQSYLSALAAEDLALVVAARVVAVPRPGQAVLDAGSKALSSDRAGWLTGHGLILEAPGATIGWLSEEHAVVHDVPESLLSVGDLVRVVPNHACPVINLTSEIVVVRDGAVVDTWPVVARR